MLGIGIGILAALMVVGGALWIKPSRREQKLAVWRRDAIVAGMQVRLKGMDAEPKNTGIREDVLGVSYILHNMDLHKKPQQEWAVVQAEGWYNDDLPAGWAWYGHKPDSESYRQHIASLLEQSPYPLVGLERTMNFVRFVWKENGDTFDAAVLKQYLAGLQVSA
ncbi:MAG: hypothetical protein H7A09_04635 [Oceanospirillaceae bacterium]|nr:hypothetical protein [Oceanospirillaceae bacterium]MCP5349472.1 hypothetical protein [Oceanospirillaceae bacterium]